MYRNIDHPLNAVRASDAKEWAESERFKNIVEYLNSTDENRDLTLPVQMNPEKLIGKNVSDVESKLLSDGFSEIETFRKTESEKNVKDGTILAIRVDGNEATKEDYYKRDTKIEIDFFEGKTEDEIAAEHPGEILIKENYKYYSGKETETVKQEFEEMGFANIEIKEMAISKLGFFTKAGTVAKLMIDGNSNFEKGGWYKPEVAVVIYSYVSV